MAYIKLDRNQQYLIPPKIQDLFSKNHICYLIEQITDSLDYSDFDTKYDGAGAPAYNPRIILKLLLLGHIDGIRSSRKLSKNSQENVVYIYLSEKTNPDFRTISDFRKDNAKLIKEVSLQINKFALENGLIDLSHLLVDGTIFKANSSDEKIIDRPTLLKLSKYIEEEIQKSIDVDNLEDKLYDQKEYSKLPKTLNDSKKRRVVVRKIVGEINDALNENNTQEILKIKDKLDDLHLDLINKDMKRVSITDPESRFMLNKKGKIELSYNAQLTVDKKGLILNNYVTQNGVDRKELLQSIEGVENTFGELPKGTKVGADAGYENGVHLEKLENKGFDLYVPGKGMGKNSKPKKFDKTNFKYNFEKDEYICPKGKTLVNKGNYFHKHVGQDLIKYQASDCGSCLFKQECCKKAKNRSIQVMPQDKLMQRIKLKLKTPRGKEVCKIRSQTVERSFGDIKHNKNFRTFLLRGLKKVNIEFDLVCMAHNLVMIRNRMEKKAKKTCVYSNINNFSDFKTVLFNNSEIFGITN